MKNTSNKITTDKEGHFAEEELEKAIKTGTTNPALQLTPIKTAVDFIFGPQNELELTPQRYLELLEAAYTSLDLEKHGLPHFICDVKNLIKFFAEITTNIKQKQNKDPENVFIVGCGPGRLAPFEVAIATKLGFKEIVFNDLLDQHIEKTRTRLMEAFNTSNPENIEGIDIKYQTGDIVEVAEVMEETFDAIFAWWFVTPEIADFSSTEALRKKRETLYKNIVKILKQKGFFIEDIPDSSTGFFYWLRAKTFAVLQEKELLEGENQNMIVTNYSNYVHQKAGGFPYHIRYAPTFPKHTSEMIRAGLIQSGITETTMLPSGIADYQQFQEIFDNPKHLLEMIMGDSLQNVLKVLQRGEAETLNFPDLTDPLAKRKNTSMWQKRCLGK